MPFPPRLKVSYVSFLVYRDVYREGALKLLLLVLCCVAMVALAACESKRVATSQPAPQYLPPHRRQQRS